MADKPRGGAAVGLLADIGPVEAGSVLCLRLWSEGVAAQDALRRSFHDSLGPRHGTEATEALCGLVEICGRHARRPLMRHHLDCACLGADEASFAHFVAAAAEGEREDAMLIASLMVRPDMAPMMTELGCAFGLAMRRMALREATPGAGMTRTTTLH